MKNFIDLEFTENGPEFPLSLISIGIVREDGQEYYATVDFEEIPWDRVDNWLLENVIVHLDFSEGKSKDRIAKEIVNFVGPSPEFWGYYCDYDWVILCQLYGKMINLPESWPMFCMDLKQLTVEKGNPKLPDLPNKVEHCALWDAREIKYRYDWLMAEKQ